MRRQRFIGAALLLASALGAEHAAAQTLSDLLINEVVVTPTAGEFVEIINTGSVSLDLTDVYLTDATFAGDSVFYFKIVTGDLAQAGGGGFSDWHARFPTGATIAPGELQTVSLAGATEFFGEYGALPTYEMCDTDRAVPDMLEALVGSIDCAANSPGFTNGGEFLVLYTWDGASDLVADIDYLVWGDKDEAVDKSGASIDGPDGDMDPSTYQSDTAIATQAVVAAGGHAGGDAFARADPSEGAEVQDGGNGVSGADETSEDLFSTYCQAAATPGVSNDCEPPPPPVDATLVLNEFQYDPASDTAGDANGDGIRDGSEDEFIELVNAGTDVLDISDWTIADQVDVRHEFAPGTLLAPNCGIVVFGGGAPTGEFGGFTVATASSGLLGLNNGGDTIFIADGSGALVTEFTYDGSLAADQSATRDPDLLGAFVPHTTAIGGEGALFSPGKRVDESEFGDCSGPVLTLIHDIQGAQHRSPLEGQVVSVEALVTVVTADGFYLQEEDIDADGDPATSEGIFVFNGSNAKPTVGDLVQITDEVEEFRPGDNRTTITQFVFPNFTIMSSANPLPTPVVLGVDRVQPTQIIDNDSVDTINIEIDGSFDANEDGIDFYESLEGMLVQANDLFVSGGTTVFGSTAPGNVELYTLVDNGANAGPRTINGGVYIAPSDFNPENLVLNNEIVQLPLDAKAGDLIPGAVTGIITSNFGKYFLQPTSALGTVIDGALPPESTTLIGDAERLTVASYNVENLDPQDGDGDADVADGKFIAIASSIVNQLGSPDIIGLQEMQDSSGSLDDGIVDAELTAAELIVHIEAEGGPTYEYVEVAPFDRDNGGQPGGNIRTALLYNPARVRFVESGNAGAGDAVDAIDGPGVPDLTLSPGLIDPSQFVDSRKPIVGEFLFNGQTVYVVSNHWNSKSGDSGLFDVLQPPVLFSETERLVQSDAVTAFVQDLLTLNPSVKLVVLGDLNDFEFSSPVQQLVDAGLTNLVETIPPSERYSFVFNGNSQVLDHVLVSPSLAGDALLDMVHVNADFAETQNRASDHDPLAASLFLPTRADETFAYYRDSVGAGSIVGEGVDEAQTRRRLARVGGLIVRLDLRLDGGQNAASCALLDALNSLTDGVGDDFVSGDGVAELRTRFESIAAGAGCQ
ncbi:MAG: lamin tail domain-containing protein [Pseudomonadota bacterium]